MHLILEITIQPFLDQTRGLIHVQQKSVTVQDLAHVSLRPHGDPVTSRFVVRIRVHDVGSGAFLRQSPGKSIARDRSIEHVR